MADLLKIACVQFTSGPDIAVNTGTLEKAVREAASKGARFITTPENSCHMIVPSTRKLETAFVEEEHPMLLAACQWAAELKVSILLGSLSIIVGGDKLANRSFLISDAGEVLATYDKIHLFDVDLPTGESHRESALFNGGTATVLAETNFARIGLSICYDVRFASLFRKLAKQGAQIITVPAAFTVPTGKAHWEVLLRARAIETGCFIVAPAQCGEHDGGRHTYGHSLIIAPWGEILAEAGDAPEIIYADIDLAKVDAARFAIPSLQHDRPL